MVHWKGYERADDSWKPIDNLDHSLELIEEYRKANHPAEQTPKITSHYVKSSWEPMEVSTMRRATPTTADDFWEPYDDEAYDSGSSELEYFPIYQDGLLCHKRSDEEDKED